MRGFRAGLRFDERRVLGGALVRPMTAFGLPRALDLRDITILCVIIVSLDLLWFKYLQITL